MIVGYLASLSLFQIISNKAGAQSQNSQKYVTVQITDCTVQYIHRKPSVEVNKYKRSEFITSSAVEQKQKDRGIKIKRHFFLSLLLSFPTLSFLPDSLLILFFHFP